MSHQLVIAYLVFIGFILLFVPLSVNTVIEVRFDEHNLSENATQIYGETIFGDEITVQQLEPPKFNSEAEGLAYISALLDYGIQYIGYIVLILFVTSTISWVNFLIIIPMTAGLIWAILKLLKPDWL